MLYLPYLTRADTPYWDGAARGAWVGLRERHGLAHMYRAILEGIAFELRMLLRMVDAELGTATRRIRAMGGGVQSGLWVRLLADILAEPVEMAPHAEATALGAAILAAAAVGLDGERDVAATAQRMSRDWRAVEPERDGPASRRYRQLGALYERLYPALSPIFAGLDVERSMRRSGDGRARGRVRRLTACGGCTVVTCDVQLAGAFVALQRYASVRHRPGPHGTRTDGPHRDRP